MVVAFAWGCGGDREEIIVSAYKWSVSTCETDSAGKKRDRVGAGATKRGLFNNPNFRLTIPTTTTTMKRRWLGAAVFFSCLAEGRRTYTYTYRQKIKCMNILKTVFLNHGSVSSPNAGKFSSGNLTHFCCQSDSPSIFLFAVYIRPAWSVFCYKCESYRDFRCLDPFDYQPHVQVNCDYEPFVRDRKPVFCEKVTELGETTGGKKRLNLGDQVTFSCFPCTSRRRVRDHPRLLHAAVGGRGRLHGPPEPGEQYYLCCRQHLLKKSSKKKERDKLMSLVLFSSFHSC